MFTCVGNEQLQFFSLWSVKWNFIYASLVARVHQQISLVFLFLLDKNWNFKNFFSIFTTSRTNYLAGQTNDLELWGILCRGLHFRKCLKETVILFLLDCLKRCSTIIWENFLTFLIWRTLDNFRTNFVAISRFESCELPRVSLSNEPSRNFFLIGLNFSAFQLQTK